MSKHELLLCTDRATLGTTRMTGDGYLVADAKVARTGIQIYLGREVGKPEMTQVRVYRPEEEVFSTDALASFAHRPVTTDHPPEKVTAKNWKQHSVGATGGEVARDGTFIRIPMVVMDQAAIDEVTAGKRELSMGYSCNLDWTAGTTPEGEAYDAIQKNIRGNHLAIVAAGRAGSECRIGDAWPVTDADPAAKLIAKLTAECEQIRAATAAIKDQQAAEVAAKDAELADLDRQIAALKAQEKVMLAKVDAMVIEKADVIHAANAIMGPCFDTEGKNAEQIRREVVVEMMGAEFADALCDSGIAGAFTVFRMRAGVPEVHDPVRSVIIDRATSGAAGSSQSAHDEMVAKLRTAWQTPDKGGPRH